LIVLVVIVILGVVVITYACTRIIIPALGKLKNRFLVEEAAVEASYDKKPEVKE
jgi:hypothetical protein